VKNLPHILSVFILCGSLLAQIILAQTPAPPSNGSISGTVMDAETGLPMQGRIVSISLSSAPNVETDLHGHYKFPDLPPGRYSVQVNGEDLVQEPASVNLAPGQDRTSLDFAVSLLGSISGRVTDQDERPVAGAWVLLLTKTYRNGELRNGQTSLATTDSQGRYKLDHVVTGRAYTVLTKTKFREIPSISQAPDDPAKRPLALTPTYYPNSAFAEGGQIIALHSGERLEDVDIRAKRGPSYCVEGVTEAGGEPAALNFEINDSQAVNNGDGISGGATIVPAHGTAGPSSLLCRCADFH
jgi:Carboxypeptidase regulatory-like domain